MLSDPFAEIYFSKAKMGVFENALILLILTFMSAKWFHSSPECVYPQVRITVTDGNDNDPEFSELTFEAEAREDMSVGSEIASVHVSNQLNLPITPLRILSPSQ